MRGAIVRFDDDDDDILQILVIVILLPVNSFKTVTSYFSCNCLLYFTIFTMFTCTRMRPVIFSNKRMCYVTLCNRVPCELDGGERHDSDVCQAVVSANEAVESGERSQQY